VALGSGASIQTQYGYDPYGVTQTTGVASTNSYQFTGRENDQTAAGLMYYRARYYNPAWGRFVSEDPIGIAGGVNLYGYVEENPETGVDPSGTQEIDLNQTCQTFIAANCKASILSVFPGQYLSCTIQQLLDDAKEGNAAARTGKKLLWQKRFRK
jgi:RHS repeat-associated protein